VQVSVVRPFVALEPVSDVIDNGARIRTSYVASENRDKGAEVGRSRGSGGAGARRSFVMKVNVAHPSEIGLHGASKLLGGCSTSLDQLLHPPSYASRTLHECNVVLAGYVGSVVVPRVLVSAFPVQSFSHFLTGSCNSPPTTYHLPVATHRLSTPDSRLPTGFSTQRTLFIRVYPWSNWRKDWTILSDVKSQRQNATSVKDSMVATGLEPPSSHAPDCWCAV